MVFLLDCSFIFIIWYTKEGKLNVLRKTTFKLAQNYASSNSSKVYFAPQNVFFKKTYSRSRTIYFPPRKYSNELFKKKENLLHRQTLNNSPSQKDIRDKINCFLSQLSNYVPKTLYLLLGYF